MIAENVGLSRLIESPDSFGEWVDDGSSNWVVDRYDMNKSWSGRVGEDVFVEKMEPAFFSGY